MTPALAIITSKGSPFLSSPSAHALTLFRLARSSATTSKPPPLAAASFLTSSVAASAFFKSRAAPTTWAPCAASERAVSTPRPEETPVTRTRLPLRFTPDRTSSVVEVSPNTLAIVFLLLFLGSASLELRGALLQKRLRAFLFVFCSGAESEERSFQRQTFCLACFQTFVDRFKCVLHRERRVGENLFQNCFRARDELRSRNDLVNQSDAISFLSADDFSGENELQRATFSDQPRQTLCAAAAWDHSQFHFGLTE